MTVKFARTALVIGVLQHLFTRYVTIKIQTIMTQSRYVDDCRLTMPNGFCQFFATNYRCNNAASYLRSSLSVLVIE